MSQLHALGVTAEKNKELYSFSCVDPSVLERFSAPNKGQTVTIACDEFTSLCPVTGQPDFGKIRITYVPDEYCVESKSLKLYLMGFRQTGAFAEKCVQMICTDLQQLLSATYLKVQGDFAARGGIAICPESEVGHK